jgi:hypothetical protein
MSQSNTARAKRTVIQLGNILLEVFLLENGQYRLSQTQVAEAVGKGPQSLSDFLKSKSPEALPYKGLRFQKTCIEGNNVKVNAIPIDLAAAYWTKEAVAGNAIAARLLGACAAESIERRADAQFGIDRREEERNQRLQLRIEGKIIRREFTDAIKDYIARHPEQSDNRKQWMYVNASEKINLLLFGAKASKLREQNQCKSSAALREGYTIRQAIQVMQLEDKAIKFIDTDDLDPVDAVVKAHSILF